MDYVCKVIGDLSIEENDFKIKMSFNEILNLNPEDFKASPRLRAALRNREIEVYTPALHQKAKKIKNRRNMQVIQENIMPLKTELSKNTSYSKETNSEISEMKNTLGNISNKMNSVVTRLDLLVTKVIESNNSMNSNFNRYLNDNKNIQVHLDDTKLDNLLDKVIDNQDKLHNFIVDQHKVDSEANLNNTDNKLDKLLDTVEQLLEKGIKIPGNNLNTNSVTYSNISNGTQVHIEDDIPTYVPNLDIDLSQKNIVTEAIESSGTDSILEKLKNLK